MRRGAVHPIKDPVYDSAGDDVIAGVEPVALPLSGPEPCKPHEGLC